jgi:hypothetical protein
MRIIIAKGLCRTCYQRKYRGVEDDPFTPAAEQKRNQQKARLLLAKMINGLDDLKKFGYISPESVPMFREELALQMKRVVAEQEAQRIDETQALEPEAKELQEDADFQQEGKEKEDAQEEVDLSALDVAPKKNKFTVISGKV